MESKFELRQRLRQKRRALKPRQRQNAASAASRHLARSPLFRHSHRIACYFAVDGELDLMPLMQAALNAGKQIYLPCLHGFGPQRLWFRRWHGEHQQLRRNRFGIREPDRSQRLGARELDLVLAPLLAFDGLGQRLGMGGGFYDRTFAFLRHRRRWQKPRVIGAAYAFQELDQLHAEPWDVPLSGVITEHGLRRFDR